MSIQDVEAKIAQLLASELKNSLANAGYSLPQNSQPRVSLLDANGRKKRSNAGADNWSPHSGLIQIWFEASATEASETFPSPHKQINGEHSAAPGTYIHPAEAELLRSLDRAESTPGWSFVPLKKFRDEILPQEHCPSIRTDVERQSVLRSTIEKKLVLKGQVINPKAPQFPVTTVRVNRMLPEVNALLGSKQKFDLEFHPVEIDGEPLSTTILRERR